MEYLIASWIVGILSKLLVLVTVLFILSIISIVVTIMAYGLNGDMGDRYDDPTFREWYKPFRKLHIIIVSVIMLTFIVYPSKELIEQMSEEIKILKTK